VYLSFSKQVFCPPRNVTAGPIGAALTVGGVAATGVEGMKLNAKKS
jgi:hypothetical protein